MGETKENTFSLPNEIVTVKFIKRKKGLAANVDDNHVISGGMLNGTKKTFRAPLKRSGGGVLNVLTSEEKDYLEDVMRGVDLSVYGDYWHNFAVSLFKTDADNRFDMSDPIDYMSIKLLLSRKDDIAPSWTARNKKSTYQFAIAGSGEEQKERKARLDVKKQAFKIYGKLEDDREKLIGIISLLSNKPISTDSKLDWLQGEVENYVDTMPGEFLDIVEDTSFDTKILIKKCIREGVITRNSNKLSTVDGLELCEEGQTASFGNAVRYLDKPEHQEVRSLLEARVDK